MGFLESLFDLPVDLTSVIVLGGLAVARIAPIFFLVPFLGGKTLPNEAKIALAVVLAVVLFPALAPGLASVPSSPVAVAALLAKEVLIGAALGIVAALPFSALEMSGRIIDTLRGATMSEVLDPHSGQRISPIGELHLLVGVAVFLAIGGHRAFLRTLARSFVEVPLLSFPSADAATAGAFASGVAHLGGAALAAALGLAGPAIVALVTTEIALGILNRAAPQMGVYFVGMPLRAAAGLLAAMLTVALLLPVLRDGAGDAIRVLGQLLHSLP
ncbi:MAG: flagellar biosynthetic protein FliR [Deltaproteobacteria bacterium]|nr:flagellar biosynthetic protein FliR [Deltaproteobacteria bacterium]